MGFLGMITFVPCMTDKAKVEITKKIINSMREESMQAAMS